MQRDIHYRKAKSEGYRARSAYKLLEILEELNVREVPNVLDLCAAPGSWSQVASRISKGGVLAVDIQDIEPIEGVSVLKGDITSEEVLTQIMKIFSEKVSLILCDGAPEVTGLHDLDEYFHSSLISAASSICRKALSEKGIFIAKIFTGESPDILLSELEEYFTEIRVIKPKSSRIKSKEAFVIATGLKLQSKG